MKQMNFSTFILILSLMFNFNNGIAQNRSEMSVTEYSENLVRTFLEVVRAGQAPERATDFMAAKVLAHQINSSDPTTVERTPENYTEHVKSFLESYGPFEFEITELIAQEDKVYARWKQTGKHLEVIDGYPATGRPLIEYASAVYRVKDGKIVEYWIQIDQAGFEAQLKKNTSKE